MITILVLFIAALHDKFLGVSSLDETFKSPNISSRHQKQQKETLLKMMLTSDEKQKKTWLERKDSLNTNIDRVCKKYGKSISKDVDTRNMFMFDSEHDLLFCRNAKVNHFLRI